MFALAKTAANKKRGGINSKSENGEGRREGLKDE